MSRSGARPRAPSTSRSLRRSARSISSRTGPATTREATRAALGGTYPAASFYAESSWVDAHKEESQKLANAFVKTQKFINTHTGAEIADKMPKDYYVGDKEGYVKALHAGKAMFTPDGIMPQGGPETVLTVLSAFKKELQGKQIDLSKTYTSEFVKNAK